MPIVQAMDVQAVRLDVTVEHVHVEPFARLSVNHRSRNAPFHPWLIGIGGNERIVLEDGIGSVQVFPVDEGVQRAPIHLCLGNGGILMPHVPHAVETVLVMLRIVRCATGL